jgi:hypothetical protein
MGTNLEGEDSGLEHLLLKLLLELLDDTLPVVVEQLVSSTYSQHVSSTCS